MAWTRMLRRGKGKGHGFGIHLGYWTDEKLRDWTWRVRKRLEPLSAQWCHRWDGEGWQGNRERDVLVGFDDVWFELLKWQCHEGSRVWVRDLGCDFVIEELYILGFVPGILARAPKTCNFLSDKSNTSIFSFFKKKCFFFLLGHTTWHMELPRPGIQPVPPAVEAWSQPLDHQGSPWARDSQESQGTSDLTLF